MASIGNWSSGTSPEANTWNSVCWSPIYNRFVAVSTNGNNRVMYSSNGINWSLSSAPAAYAWYSVVCSQERFVAIAIYQLNGIMYSSDGINNWQLGTAPYGEWRRACWSPQLGRFVAVGKSGAIVMYSDNGINWSTSGITGASGFTWLGVCWAAEAQSGIYVAVAEEGKVMISSNGINWALQTDVINNTWWNVCWSPQLTRFVAVADRGTNNVMYSNNGSNWLAASGPVPCNDVCWSPEAGSYIALASDGRRMISTNGINWTAMTSSTTGFVTGLSIVWSPGVSRFVSVGYNTVMSVLVTVTTAPSAPQTLTATAGNSEVILNWSIPASTGGSAILEYIVTMNYVPTPTNSTATSKTIYGLINTTYTFTVTARNAIGTSGSSNPAIATPFTAPSAPTILTVTPSNSNVIVTWSAGATNGSTRSGYIIQRSVDQTNWTNHIAGSNDISITISGLTNGTTYYFRVITQSNAGDSTPSSTLSATPFTTPSAPTIGTAISSNNSAIVNWTPLSQGSSDIITFTTVGSFNFTAPRSGTVEVLIVGGGGGGGQSLGGGGGGGGVIYIPSVNVTANTNYLIVVGDGGASSTNGQNSSAFTSIAVGGGAGGEYRDISGKDGGCGGGAGTTESNFVYGGMGHSELVQDGITTGINIRGSNSNAIMHGFRGGKLTVARGGNYKAPGGGGAGAPGLDTDPLSPNDEGQYGASSGGQGISYNILGTSYYWAGGGGGGNWSAARAGWGGLGGGGGGSGVVGGPGGGSALTSGFSGNTAQADGSAGGAGGANTGGGGGGGAYGNPGGKGGSGIVVIRYNAAYTNGSNITGYIVTDNYGVSTPLISGINATTTTITGLTNEKTYTFKVKAVSSNAGNSVDSSSSNIVLPIAPTSITTGSDFIGKTLVIGSTALSSSAWARIFDFNSGSQYLVYVFIDNTQRHALYTSYGPTIQNSNYVPAINTYYIYTISFVSSTQIKLNVYEYVYTSNTIISKDTITTLTPPNTLLQVLNNLWLGRSRSPDDPFYNGRYDKVALYNGDLFALSDANILSTLLTLVQSTASNVYYNSTTNYAFRPTINNFMGVVVNILNYNTGSIAGSTVTPSNITLIGTGTSSGGFLNITGSFVELSTAPRSVTATVGPGNGQITVNWTQPENNGGNISSYTVTSTPVTTPITVTGQTTLTTTFSGLTIGTSYTFRVVAINAAGTSPLSAASNSVTAATLTTVPSVPRTLTADASNSQVILNWSIPSSDGGSAILEYIVTINSVPTSTDSTATTRTITGLTKGTTYIFSVTARNTIGTSGSSNSVSVTIPVTVPSEPRNLTNISFNNIVDLSWNAPLSTGGRDISSYIIEKSTEFSPTWVIDSSTNATTRFKQITGLASGTPYFFRVRARNVVGDSLPSNESRATTPPSAPQNLTIISGNTFVDLSWNSPSYSGGEFVVSYTIEKSINSINWNFDSSTNNLTRFKRVTSLINDTRYYFRVYAVSAAGNGSVSAVVMAIPYTVPSAPTITATAGNSLVNLSWNEPSNNGRDISSYTITRSYDNINWDIILVVPISDTLPLLTFTSANDFAMYFNIRFSTPTAILKVDSEYYLSQGNGPTYREYMHPLQLYYNNTTTGQAIITNGQGNMLIDGEVLRPRNVTIELIDSRGRNFILTRFCNPYPY